MKKTNIDCLGRIVIPKVFRNQLGLSAGTPIRFRVDENLGILILQKNQKHCIKCNSEEDLIKIKDGVYICSDCYKSLIL